MTLLEKLIEKQRASGLNDPDFAQFLGVSYENWNKVKRQERKIGTTIITAVVRVYPGEFNDLIIDEFEKNYGNNS